MPYGVGAGGLLGIALESVSGTYEPPTHFVPILNESLKLNEDTQLRRPIRETPAVVGAVPGNEHVDGEINMEAMEDVVALFLHAARVSVDKQGTAPNFTYTFTPSAIAVPAKTLSITVKRSEQIFGYTGCIVGQFKFSISNGVMQFGVTLVGRDEAEQTAPSPVTWPTTAPFGAGQYAIEIPTGAPVFDTDTFEWTCNDNPEPQFRLKNTGRGAQFAKFGERDLQITMGRDFIDRSDYDAFKAVTAQSITIKAVKGPNNSIELLTPVTIKETYEVGLSGQGDLLRANIQYRPMLDGTGKDYQIIVKTQEDITA